MKRDLSVSMLAANIYSLLFALPIVGLLTAVYILRWGTFSLPVGPNFWIAITILLGILIVGAIAHELIHAWAWMWFGKKPASAFKLGFQWKSLTPYAHAKEPIEVNAYRLGTAAPGLILGILPSLLGIITGNSWLIGFGLLFTFAAGGDMLILWLIRNVPAGKLVEDHPTRAGCYVLEER